MDEVARYDRQMRLWGAATQQQLKRTRVHVRGAHGTAAELAKNLVLAGVGALDVCDAAAVTAADYRNNFLVQRDDAAATATRGERVAAALRRLNPLVRTRVVDDGDGEDDKDGGAFVVCVAHARSLREVRTAARRGRRAALLLVHVACDAATVATLCLRGGAEVDAVLCRAASLAREPAAFQRAALLLHLRDALPSPSPSRAADMAHVLAAAVRLTRALRLVALRPRDVAAVARCARVPCACGAAAATMAGAAAASLVVQCAAARASGGDTGGDGAASCSRARWLLCDAAAGEARVGGAVA